MALGEIPGGGNPELMRQRLRFRLRAHREAARLTQREVATTLYWGLSKVIRIEQGTVSVAPTDVRALLGLYHVQDATEVAELVELAQKTRHSPWTKYRDVYSKSAIELFGSERSAKIIRKYESELVPGLLQTEDYATSLLQAFGFEGANLELRVEARLLRQAILSEADRPYLEFIIGEAVISRPVGGQEAMLRQLAHLKDLAGHENLTLQVLPMAAGPHRRMGGGFTIIEFREDLNDLLYRESSDREESTKQDPALTAEYLQDFIDLQALALAQNRCVPFIDDIIARRF